MDRATCWRLVGDAQHASAGSLDAAGASLRAGLLALGPDACLGFDLLLGQLLAEACTWDLWGAAYMINGGCSDDGFLYFRCWLIAQGETTFKQAVAEPDSLADVVDRDDDEHEYEDLLYIGRACFEELTGEEAPEGHVLPGTTDLPVPRGEPWLEQDLAARLPRLARYCEWSD